MIAGCIDDPVIEQGVKGGGLPVLEGAPTVVSKTANTIEVTATVTQENGSTVTERGFVYDVTSEPTLTGGGTKRPASGSGIGTFTLTLADLSNNTDYYIRSYATNEAGTAYSAEIKVSTNTGLGVVATLTPSNVHATSATVGGQITLAGEGSIMERGVKVSLSYTFITDTSYISADLTDLFSCLLTDLQPATTYYVKAYVTNTYGTVEGVVDSLTTGDGKGAVVTLTPKDVYAIEATVGGKITDEGEGTIIKRGVLISTTKNFIGVDTILSSKDTIEYTCKLTQPLLMPAHKYYVKAFAESVFGSFEGEIDSLTTRDGLFTIGSVSKGAPQFSNIQLSSSVSVEGDHTVQIVERGFCWSVSQPLTVETSDTVHCGSGDGPFSGQINGISPPYEYYAKAYAINQFGDVLYSSETVTFKARTNVPTVETLEVSNIVNGAADLSGLIADAGSDPVTAAGFYWSTTPSTSSANQTPVSPWSSNLSATLTGLKGGVTYYVQAYATNVKGTSYGEWTSFTTPPVFNTGLKPFPAGYSVPLSNSYGSTNGYFTINNCFYILGGDAGPSYSDKLWYYRYDIDEWFEARPFKGGQIKWPTCVVYGYGAFITGGVDNNENPYYNMYYYNQTDNQWTEHTDVADTAYQTTGLSFGSSLYYIGGRQDTVNAMVSPSKGDTVKNEVWRCDYPTSGGSWTFLSEFPVKQYGGVIQMLDNTIYAGLGRDTLGNTDGRFWMSTDECLTWTEVTPCDKLTGAVLGSIKCLYGGYERLYVVDDNYYIIEYDPMNDVWTRKPSQIPVAYRNFNGIFEANGKLYIGMGIATRNFVEYDISWDN
jgi:hypothetical protein